jgi:hypothetical protein
MIANSSGMLCYVLLWKRKETNKTSSQKNINLKNSVSNHIIGKPQEHSFHVNISRMVILKAKFIQLYYFIEICFNIDGPKT